MVRALSRRLIAERGVLDSAVFACHEVVGMSPFAPLGRTLECEIFQERFGNDVAVMTREYRQYEQASRFFILVDQTSQMPVGVIRVIRSSPAGLKTLNDIAGPPLNIPTHDFLTAYKADLSSCWDVGTLAVAPAYRGRSTRYLASAILYRALYAAAADQSVNHLVSIVDGRARKGLDLLGVPFEPILGSTPFDYLGSEQSTALVGYVPGMPEVMTAHLAALKRQVATDPEGPVAGLAALVEGLISGKGLDPMIPSRCLS